MRSLTRLFLLPMIAIVAIECGDSGPEQVTVADLAGTWRATEFSIDDDDDVIPKFDVVQELLGSLTITVTSNGSFTGTLKATAFSDPVPVAGSITIQGMSLTIAFTQGLDQPIAGDFALSGDDLTITGSGLTVTFEGETIDSATVILVMRRL